MSTSTPTLNDTVTTSFALGWQIARLYASAERLDAANARPAPDLPGLSELPSSSLVELGVAQVERDLASIAAFLGPSATGPGAAGVDGVPDAAAASADAGEGGVDGGAAGEQNASGDGTALPTTTALERLLAAQPVERDKVRGAILELHVQLLIYLTAVNFRLGKAYGLGRAMADTCSSAADRDPQRQTKALEHHLNPYRARELEGWLDDLKSVLPAHSAQAVADSLEQWVQWGQKAKLEALNPTQVKTVTRLLHRAGQRWRAILSGEKDARDVLEIGDYVSAARAALARAGAIARGLAVPLAGPLLAAVVLVGVGIALMLLNNSTAQVLAGLGTLATTLGLTWRSAAKSLERTSLDLSKPLWGAALDAAIGSRLTALPQIEPAATGAQRPDLTQPPAAAPNDPAAP